MKKKLEDTLFRRTKHALTLLFFLAAIGCVADSASKVSIGADKENKTWSIETPEKCVSEFTRNTDSSWTFNYQFPTVTYNYNERNCRNIASLPVEINIPEPVFQFEIMNMTNTEHMLFLYATCKDGSIWSSRPLALNWTGQWKTMIVPSSEMRRETDVTKLAKKMNAVHKEEASFDPHVVKLSLVVNQSMSGKLATTGYYRKGQLMVRNISASSGKSQDSTAKMFFEGKVFRDKKVNPSAKESFINLSSLEPGKSRYYPMKTGIPFPEGAIYDMSNIQLLADGKDCQSQTKTLSSWPDGSIRVLQMEFPADLTGAVSYKLAYGGKTKAKFSDQKPVCTEDNGEIIVNAEGLYAKFSKNSGNLIDELCITNEKGEKQQMFSPDGCKSVLKDNKNVIFPATGKIVTLEQNGPLSCVIKIDGIYALDGKKSGYSFSSRFYFMRGSKSVRCSFTFVNESGITDNPMPDISIEGTWGNRQTQYQFGAEDSQNGKFNGRPVRLFQDGAAYEKQLVKYPFTISSGTDSLGKGSKFDGFISSDSGSLKVNIGIFECWQNNPKKISLSEQGFSIYPSCMESCRNGTPRSNFYHGMSKTQQIMFGFDEQNDVLDFLKEPMFVPSPEWLCASGVFGKMDPEDRIAFPFYEKTKDKWINDVNVLMKKFGDQYGLRDFGDYFADGPDVWMNLETAVGMGLFRQFIRTGRKEYLSLARQSIMHFADIDTCHAPGLGSDKESELGAVYGHTYHHAGKAGTMERNMPYLQITGGGHDWYSEIVYMYLLNGDERLRDCAIIHADNTASNIGKYFKEDHVLAREYAWPLKNLCSAYQISNKPEYMVAAAKIMNFFSYWRESFATSRLGFPALCWESVRDYYETTKDPLAKELFIIAGHSLIDNAFFLPDSDLPEICLYNVDRRVMLLDVLPDMYEITGKDEYVKKYVGMLYFFMQNNLYDSTVLWSSPRFLKAMKTLGLKEPFSKPFLPVISDLTQRASGKPTGEVLIEETQDGDFTVSLSRVAAFRMGRVARGLIVGDWEGYPDSGENKMRTEEPRFKPEHFGHIRVISPNGKTVLDEKLKEYYSKTYTYKIPKDGITGTYRVTIEMVDTLYHEMLVDSSLPRLTLVNSNGFPNIGTVYFKVPDDKEFSVKVGPRKNGRFGGAVLYSPYGKIADELYWDPTNKGTEFILKGKGAGIWKLERSMFSTTSKMSLESIPDILGASPEAFDGK